MSKATRFGIIVFCLIALAVVIVGYLFRDELQRTAERAMLPPALNYQQITSSGNNQPPPAITTPPSPATPIRSTAPEPVYASTQALPPEINLDIPFTPQAPHANWQLPYKEFCEEASILMAARYLQHQSIASPNDAQAAMLKIQQFEEATFGYYQDTNAAETAAILTDHLNIPATLLPNPTIGDIQSALAQGHPVIVPVAGRLLNNPHFQTPGPLYHMLVIKGYTRDGQFITNDPGTRHGSDYIYNQSTIMTALHDWRTDERILQGRQVAIIVGK